MICDTVCAATREGVRRVGAGSTRYLRHVASLVEATNILPINPHIQIVYARFPVITPRLSK
jgi:hypothetical protein